MNPAIHLPALVVSTMMIFSGTLQAASLPMLQISEVAEAAATSRTEDSSSTPSNQSGKPLSRNAFDKTLGLDHYLDRKQVKSPATKETTRYPWRNGIVTTTFWVGERPTKNNPTPNHASSWDQRWAKNFGGYDNPNRRNGYHPASFTPRQNPFYIALPYNDTTRGTTKPEASKVIPWFDEAFERPGRSVLKGRWIAIRYKDKIAYAQWEDCGPFRTDHWQYVFGDERPKPNLNKGAGLDVSPAVRDYLGMKSSDVTDWRFVDFEEVPHGPWATHGDNNTFVQRAREKNTLQQTAQADEADLKQ